MGQKKSIIYLPLSVTNTQVRMSAVVKYSMSYIYIYIYIYIYHYLHVQWRIQGGSRRRAPSPLGLINYS